MFKWFKNNEHGSVMVIVAIAMTVLLGFTGLAVDYGSLALTRQELQNAADAAALAAGQDKLNGYDTTVQTSTASSYITANGINLADGVTTFQIDSTGGDVRVTITTQKSVGFSSVLTGRKSEQVSATAVAEVMNTVANYPYALFAGNTINDSQSGVIGNGNNVTINGNVHSNTNVNIKHATVTGAVTAVDYVEYKGTKIPDSNDPLVPMPSTHSIVQLVKSHGAFFDGSEDGTDADGVIDLKKMGGFDKFVEKALEKTALYNNVLNIYVNGTITYNGNNGPTFDNTAYPINLVTKDDITLGGIPLMSSSTAPIVLISEYGNVTVNGQGTTGGAFHGLIFACNGNAEFNGGKECNFYGSIYAMNITNNGGGFSIIYDSSASNHLPQGKVRLIE